MARANLPKEAALEQSPRGSERNILERSSKCKGRGQDPCVWGAAGRHVSWEASDSQDHPGSLAPRRPGGGMRTWDLPRWHHLCVACSAADLLMCLITGVAPHLVGGGGVRK